MVTIPLPKIDGKIDKARTRNGITYRRDSLRQLNNNDSRRHFGGAELERDIIPRLMKLDRYFAETRKHVHGRYNINDIANIDEMRPHHILSK